MILAQAPFRISLGGGGTDLPSYYKRFGGFVISAAISKYIYIYANRPAADDLIRVKYSKYEQVESIEEVEHDLVRPALKLLDITSGLEIASMADVSAGTGLGSSGTYLVALLTALHAFKRNTVPTKDLAEQAVHIEMDLAGHPVGKQDHYLAAFGGITALDIDKDGTVEVTRLDLSHDVLDEFRNTVLLFYTGMTRRSTDILKEQARATDGDDKRVLDSLHRTKEIGYAIRQVLEKGDLNEFGRLLDEHWKTKKQRSDRISDGPLDRWYDLAVESGALGGKVIGAGGGGFFMFQCPTQHKADLRAAMAAEGLREMRYDFDFQGAKVIVNL
ncbi:MAG: GHMP family kinase ATP-binding protein [Actinomycetota bacterium]